MVYTIGARLVFRTGSLNSDALRGYSVCNNRVLNRREVCQMAADAGLGAIVLMG